MSISTNLAQLSEMIGSYIGMSEGIEQKIYMDSIITQAWEDAKPLFHIDAAAEAASTSGLNIKHMYEYGTAGITRGRSKRINPTSPQARLWVDTLTGKGGVKTASWVFRPATQMNPKHTTESTGGIAQETLDKLRVNTGKKQYRFKQKAMVYETGISVKILPKDAKALFVPLIEGVDGATAEERRKGYAWRKHSNTSPGDTSDSTGHFASFFVAWWSEVGHGHMERSMEAQVKGDLERSHIDITAASRKGGIRPVQSTNVNGMAAAGKTKTRKQWTIYAEEKGFGRSKIS